MRESENRLRNARRVCTCCSESDESRAPVCIATSRVSPPATRWPTVHLRRATHGSRNARLRERLHMLFRVGRQLCAGPGRRLSGCPSRHALADRAYAPCHATPRGPESEGPRTSSATRAARRACTCCSESDDSCAPVCIATSPVAHHALRRATKGSRNARVREQAAQRANALQHCRRLCAASGTLPPPFLDGRKSVVSTARATCEHRRRLRSRMRTGNPRYQGWPNLSTCATGASTDASEDGATSISIDNG